MGQFSLFFHQICPIQPFYETFLFQFLMVLSQRQLVHLFLGVIPIFSARFHPSESLSLLLSGYYQGFEGCSHRMVEACHITLRPLSVVHFFSYAYAGWVKSFLLSFFCNAHQYGTLFPLLSLLEIHQTQHTCQ